MSSVLVFDADNDGFLDIAAGNRGGKAALYRNAGSGEWDTATDWLGGLAETQPRAALDADGDGDLDVIASMSGAIAVLTNEGGNLQKSISVESRGVGDNRYGIGSKVEVLAGGLRQKFEITGHK